MNTLITFDYELFLGPSTGSVDKCLIKPTQAYLDIANKHKIRYVFFVDVLYLLKAKEYKDSHPELLDDYNKVTEQLTNAARCGHDLELHIHPQWYYSTYTDTGWKLDYSHYKLTDCPIDDIKNMVTEGCRILKDITGFSPIAYRAGGYSFPNNIQITEILKDAGILFDSSVLMLHKATGKFQSYDYTNISNCEPYKFDLNNTKIQSDGCFLEYPVSCAYLSHLYCSLKMKVTCRINKSKTHIYGDGQGIGLLSAKQENNVQESLFRKLCGKQLIKASLDFTNATFIQILFNRTKSKNGSNFLLIGHPKNTTKYSLGMLNKFLVSNKENRIITFRDIK